MPETLKSTPPNEQEVPHQINVKPKITKEENAENAIRAAGIILKKDKKEKLEKLEKNSSIIIDSIMQKYEGILALNKQKNIFVSILKNYSSVIKDYPEYSDSDKRNFENDVIHDFIEEQIKYVKSVESKYNYE